MQGMARAQDDTFGEAFTLFPMVRPPNRSAQRDPERPALDVFGIFTDEADTAEPDTFRPQIASTKPNASFTRANLAWVPRTGDIIRRCCDGAQYEVVKVRPDGVSRIVFDLHQMGLPAR